MIWTVERTRVDFFEVGDRIGQKAVGGGEPQPIGDIVISEPDHPSHGWHLAWVDPDQPGKTFHWRGESHSKDTRWFVRIEYVIPELP